MSASQKNDPLDYKRSSASIPYRDLHLGWHQDLIPFFLGPDKQPTVARPEKADVMKSRTRKHSHQR